MLYHVVGIRKGMSFEVNGQRMEGLKVHALVADKNVDGMACESHFINANSDAYAAALALKPDMDAEIFFNRFGKIDTIRPLD